MLIVDQEIPIQPISKKNTNGKKQRQSYEGTFQIRASLADFGLFLPATSPWFFILKTYSYNLKSITSGKIFSFPYKVHFEMTDTIFPDIWLSGNS